MIHGDHKYLTISQYITLRLICSLLQKFQGKYLLLRNICYATEINNNDINLLTF